MRLTIAAVGRASGPEAALGAAYLSRAETAGRGIALGPVKQIEIDERKARSQAQQAERLMGVIPPGAVSIALDERGRLMTSPEFAQDLATWRDSGRAEAIFLIGGADGHTEDLRNRADLLLSFGPMVWPHMLARVMLAEQLYRAVSILAKSPYHRA